MNAPPPDAPILFFDSGLGGLTVLGPTRALLPTAPFVYAADYAGLPYGRKSNEEMAASRPPTLTVRRWRGWLAIPLRRLGWRFFAPPPACRSSAPCRRSSRPPN